MYREYVIWRNNAIYKEGEIVTIRVVDYIVKRIKEQDVEHIFFVSGAGCMFLTDALAKDNEITPVSMHHEQAASMAAVAYAQQKEGLGACFVTTGCGGTNAITGVLHAWQDGIPLIVISGQVKQEDSIEASGESVRQVGRQEADVVTMIESITKYAHTVSSAEEISSTMDRAIYEATSGRKGPVWVDVPLNIQAGVIDEKTLTGWTPEKEDVPRPDDREVDLVCDLLSKAKRPVMLIGSGIRLSGAVDILKRFEDKVRIPVVYARTAPDVFASDEEYVIGMSGTLGVNRAANFAVANADFLLVIGHRMSRDTVGDPQKYAREATICMVDIDDAEMNKTTIRIDHKIHSDANAFLEKLYHKFDASVWDEWKKKCSHWKHIFPKKDPLCTNDTEIDLYTFMDEMSDVLPERATLLSDAGTVWQLVPSVIRYDGKTMRSLNSYAQGEMGFSIPGGVGAAYANPHGTTIVMTGDGSAMMNIQELATIKYRELPIKLFIFNNGGYASIRKPQKDSFRRTIGTDADNGVGIPSYERIAYGFDLPYMRIDSNEGLAKQIKNVLDTEGTVICEVICENEPKMILTSMSMTKNRRMVMRPIEDMAPFLDRELFLNEMIVEPIDQ